MSRIPSIPARGLAEGSRRGGLKAGRAVALTQLLIVLSAGLVRAAPAIERAIFSAPAQAHVGDPVLLFANSLVAPVRVFFSDGTNPVIEAASVLFDAGRGTIFARVPAGAATGNMKISAGGVDSPLFYFRILPGAFVQGTDAVSGQATSGTTPIPGVAVALIRDTGCLENAVQDFGLTDATGHYTLHGVDGSYALDAFPPAGSGLASLAPTLSLSSSGATVNLALVAGTSVTGRAVDATTAAGIGGARISFDGPAQEAVLADASGNFAARLLAGTWKVEIRGASHAFYKVSVAISGSSQNFGNVPLSTGVRVSGLLTRSSDGTPLAGAEINAFGANLCCGKSDRQFTAGDGSYALFVPPNQTIDPAVFFDDRVNFADVIAGNQAIGTSNVVLNLQAQDAAFITGTATDLATLSGIRNLQILASSGGQPAAVAFVCVDGSYRLRVVPSAGGYVIGTGASDPSGPAYALEFWNNTLAGTYFSCEGVLVPAPAAAGMTSGISFKVPQAASVQGLVSSQAGGCADDLGSQGVFIDDGGSHGCALGVVDSSLPPPGYRIALLPPSSAVPQLRACAFVGGYNPQCWSLMTPPAYTPIVVGAGLTATGVNFCLQACVTPLTWYRDMDGDGHGGASSTTSSCSQPAGYVPAGDDCDDANAQIWGTPGEARGLLFTDAQSFSWTPPASLGGLAVVYDALRTANPADFVGAATCVESNDGSNTIAVDASLPAAGTAFFYLVRAENACPSGQGVLGTNSSGTAISGRNCP